MKKLIIQLFVIVSIMPAFADRLMYSINESWEFKKEKETVWEKVNLPHTWNIEDVVDDTDGYYRGIGRYKKELKLDASNSGKQVFMYFEGANQVTELFVNGQSVGKHTGGYTRFCFDITKFLTYEKPNLFEVKVDNSHNKNIPPFSADFNFYGGIYRDVYLVITDKVHVSLSDNASSGVYIETPKVSEKKASVKITTLVDNQLNTNTSIIIATKIKDQSGKIVWSGKSAQSITPSAQKTIITETNLEKPILWSFKNPYLYTLTTTILDAGTNAVLDEINETFGIRNFEFNANTGFTLNGEQIKLIGTNRHQDFKDKGNALPNEYDTRDMNLLKNMGGNFLRVSHYPQDPTVLEYCDRNGIAASVEIPIIGRIVETEECSENCKNMMTEMIKQNYNHPSVIIWAYMNEVLIRLPYSSNNPANNSYISNVVKLAQNLEDIAGTLDKQRYTMIPNHGNFDLYNNAGLTKIPRIVGWNMYKGWYTEKISGFEVDLEKTHLKLPEKPLIVTEYGAGVDIRIHSEKPERYDFSEEYGQQVHESYLKTIKSLPYVAGATIWNLNDFYAEGRKDATPHINNKGLVTTDRKPKTAYWFYKASLNNEPAIYIASRGLDTKSGVAKKMDDFCNQSLEVFSNLPKAEFFLNGKSLGEKQFSNNVAKWTVPFVQGENLLEVSGLKDGKLIKDVQKVQFKLIPYSLSKKGYDFENLNVNLGGNFSFFDENPNITWLPDREWEKGSWGAVGGKFYRKKTSHGSLPSSDADIKGTDIDPVYQTQRVGLKSYIADVPDGTYSVSLYFAELDSPKKNEASEYNLGNDAVNGPTEDRIFSIEINKQLVVQNLNLLAEFGEERAIEKKYIVSAKNGEGITIDFIPVKGEPVLNGIRIVRKY